MKSVLKQLILMAIVFFVMLWFQNMEDKKANYKRKDFIETYKMPLLVSALVGLAFNLFFDDSDNSFFLDKESILKNNNTISIPKSITNTSPTPFNSDIFIKNNNVSSDINSYKNPTSNTVLTNQEIFTDLPDF